MRLAEDIMWFGDKPNPSLRSTEDLWKTPTLTVEELRAALADFPPDAPVGLCMSKVHGHVNGIRRLTKDEFGCVILDMTQEGLYSDEVDIL